MVLLQLDYARPQVVLVVVDHGAGGHADTLDLIPVADPAGGLEACAAELENGNGVVLVQAREGVRLEHVPTEVADLHCEEVDGDGDDGDADDHEFREASEELEGRVSRGKTPEGVAEVEETREAKDGGGDQAVGIAARVEEGELEDEELADLDKGDEEDLVAGGGEVKHDGPLK
ncbi:hypothetical protein BC936DRAFT_140427 [Jimgerdemannia flammicorona]|uniref:Uncharacterized protein n=1 Tax=Jimgerdemannia flammicorona TaxID=994334 RepID=A0A433DH14_9FUNG|nr:hypothetical protein BC936DRAFT_140427 [Jimgerdemannia flammicorona]